MAMDIDNLIRTKTASPVIWTSTGTGGTPPNTGVGTMSAPHPYQIPINPYDDPMKPAPPFNALE